MKHLTRALRHHNYRLFFGGQTISLIGTWMTQIATSWLVYRLSGSPLLLGLAGFSSQIPIFVFSAFAGVWIDRLNLHRILVITQILAMLQSLTLAFLTLTHRVTITEIIVLGFLQGLINVFDMPARQAFVVQLVEDKKDLGNAIALNSFMVNLARLLGPMIAGFVIAGVGEGLCFLIDGISYIAVVASLLMMTLPKIKYQKTAVSILQQLQEGLRYAFGFPPIRHMLILLSVFSVMGMSYTVLMPIFAAEVFKGGAHTLGVLLSASGTGALIGAVVLASKRSVLGLGKIIVWAGMLFGVGIMIFSISKVFWISLFCLAVCGFSLIILVAAVNTILQTIVEDNKRGRLMSLFTVAFIGMAPFGSLLSGTMAKYLGAPHTLLINGLFCIGGTFLFSKKLLSIRQLVRPIYRDKGILET